MVILFFTIVQITCLCKNVFFLLLEEFFKNNILIMSYKVYIFIFNNKLHVYTKKKNNSSKLMLSLKI